VSADHLKEPCGVCKGVGRVPREVRKLADGTADPLDFRREELCMTCGGEGKVPINRAAIVEKKPGFVADSI
jgi:DnaJ-class molecular chaperone